MIFYFSGTGNSLHVAQVIGKAQGLALRSIAAELDRPVSERRYALAEDEALGFVFPVYAWGPPDLVVEFIRTMEVSGKPALTFSAATCGAEEGRTTRRLEKVLARKGLALDCAFTVPMPNNYILGYDVDPPEVAAQALAEAESLLGEINDVIARRDRGARILIPGPRPGLKSALIHPLFSRFAPRTGPFHADDTCTACGLCERICPVHSITVTDKPAWGKACVQCLACINRCPARAIQHGKATAGKGRYAHPDLA